MASKKYSDDFIRTLIIEYKNGLSCSKVDKKYNLPKGTTNALMKRKEYPKRKALKHTVDWDLIIKLKAEGKTNQQIADFLGVKVLTLKDWGLSSIESPLSAKFGVKHEELKNKHFFSSITTNLQAYMLGWITADGNITSTNQLRIELTILDESIVKMFRDVLAPSVKLAARRKEREYKGEKKVSETIIFSCKCKQWREDLTKYNVVPNKSNREIRMPILPKNLMASYIRGFFEGNGSINCGKYGTAIRLTFGSHIYLDDLGQYLNDMDIIKKRLVAKRKRNSNCSDIEFGSALDVTSFTDYIYTDSSLYLPRKRNKLTHISPLNSVNCWKLSKI